MQNKKEVLFSIIIATFNAEEDLQITLNSIKHQSCKDFELILIDGNSTDNTVNIIKNSKDIITDWISEPDKGLYDAWNKGVKKSKGKWLLFLGAGDSLNPDALYSYNNYIRTLIDIPDYISAKIRRTDEEGNFMSVIGESWNWNKFKKSMNVAHVGSLHNKDLFVEIGLFNFEEYKICADYELLLRKRDRLKTGFLNIVIGEMPIGGVSFSVKALKESAIAKYKTGKINLFLIFLYFGYYFLLYKTYSIRHSSFFSIL